MFSITTSRLRPHPHFQHLRHASSGKSKSSKQWLARQSRDPFVKQRNIADADAPTYRARSAFKLIEMNNKYGRFLNGARIVVDLGGAPGGWSQVAASCGRAGIAKANKTPSEVASSSEDDQTNNSSAIIAVDLLPILPIPGVTTLQGDFLHPSTQAKLAQLMPHGSNVDVVLSDMAPNMSGNRLRDVELSLQLCTSAFEFAKRWLVHSEQGRDHNGVLVMKYFEHPELQDFRRTQLQPSFHHISNVKPSASRSESSEAYWVCSGFRIR